MRPRSGQPNWREPVTLWSAKLVFTSAHTPAGTMLIPRIGVTLVQYAISTTWSKPESCAQEPVHTSGNLRGRSPSNVAVTRHTYCPPSREDKHYERKGTANGVYDSGRE